MINLLRRNRLTSLRRSVASVALEQPPEEPLNQHSPLLPMSSPLPIKPESPKVQPRPIYETRGGTPRTKNCNCKNSRCLKLYCKCFASRVYCDGCNCTNCYNNAENEAARHDAVEVILERSPSAFRPKIGSSPYATMDHKDEARELSLMGIHNKGCHCKKSGCLKKYCECFQTNILCSDNCKCIDCKNFEGSEERKALFYGNHFSTLYMQKDNATLNGSSQFISPTSSKRKRNQDHFMSASVKDQSIHRLAELPQVGYLKTSGPAPVSAHVNRTLNPAPLAPTKFSYRSLLADVVQPVHISDLCQLLVVVSEQAAKTLADKKVQEELVEKEGQVESSLSSTICDSDKRAKYPNIQLTSADDRSHRLAVDNIKAEGSESACEDGHKRPRPVSPGTQALMCDEQDTMIMTSRNAGTSASCHNQHVPEVYAGQESSMAGKSEASDLQGRSMNDIARAPTTLDAEPVPADSNKQQPAGWPTTRNGDTTGHNLEDSKL